MIHTDSRMVIGMAVLAVIIAAGVAMSMGHGGQSSAQINSTNSSTQAAAQNQTQPNIQKILFVSTQYAPYSYQIYPGPVSQQAQAALSGFNLTSSVLQNGTTDVRLSLTGTGSYQTVALKPDYKLYIVETTFGDDGYQFDSSLGDDGFVVVDQNGYVAQ